MRWTHLLGMFIGLVLTIVVLSTFSFTAAAQNPVEQEALIRDASQYAATMGVALDEAISRLKLQNAIGDLNAKLVANEEDTFAGLAVEHKPAYRVVARFIRNGEAIIHPYVINGSLASIVEVREAKATLKELKAARIGAAQIAERVSIHAYSAINIPENRAELYVLDLTQLDDALQKAHVQLPANVKVIKVPELPKQVSDIYGGLGLSGACTSGFSVINSNGTKGITTAGHCINSQSYQGTSLPFVAENWQGPWDIQWHTAPGFTVRNLIFDGTYNRYIFSVVFGISQYPGEWVCRYGNTSGYGCGQIVLVDNQGFNIVVNIGSQQGDSGGPWFWNNSAFGTTIATCVLSNGNPCSIYGPPEQIYNGLGLSILTN